MTLNPKKIKFIGEKTSSGQLESDPIGRATRLVADEFPVIVCLPGGPMTGQLTYNVDPFNINEVIQIDGRNVESFRDQMTPEDFKSLESRVINSCPVVLIPKPPRSPLI